MRRQPADPQVKKHGHRFGFVACIGRTNVGKSTLINRLLGQKVGIVSRKPQTTRRRVRGILNAPSAQMVLIDTPGLPSVVNPINAALEQEVRSAVEGADAVLAVTDPGSRLGDEDEGKVFDIVRRGGLPSLLALNKIDLVDRSRRERILRNCREPGVFTSVIAVSARTGENLREAEIALSGLLPPGPALFPPDILSDQPERDFLTEIVREKIFRNLHQELPYSAAVVLEEVSQDPSGLYRVRATIYVERESQKGILIGQGGAALRRIGTAARIDMERLTGTKVFLSLWVKVRKNWTKDPKSLREFGFGGEPRT